MTGINSATTTCQLRPANHDMCVSLAFKLIKRDLKCFNMNQNETNRKLLIWKLIFCSHFSGENRSKWYYFHWVTLNYIQKLLLLCLTQVLKAMLKICMHKIISNISTIVLFGIMLADWNNGRISIFLKYMLAMYFQCLLVVNPFESLYILWHLFTKCIYII